MSIYLSAPAAQLLLTNWESVVNWTDIFVSQTERMVWAFRRSALSTTPARSVGVACSHFCIPSPFRYSREQRTWLLLRQFSRLRLQKKIQLAAVWTQRPSSFAWSYCEDAETRINCIVCTCQEYRQLYRPAKFCFLRTHSVEQSAFCSAWQWSLTRNVEGRTSSLLHHSQHFVRNWTHIYSGNHTQTLFYNCFAIVVLEITVT